MKKQSHDLTKTDMESGNSHYHIHEADTAGFLLSGTWATWCVLWHTGLHTKILSQKPKRMAMVDLAYNPSNSGGRVQHSHGWRHSSQKVHEIQSWKFPTENRGGSVVQEVEHLPSNHEALCSSPVASVGQKTVLAPLKFHIVSRTFGQGLKRKNCEFRII
jgi:hypothetical protein